jgi:hypothetical protein
MRAKSGRLGLSTLAAPHFRWALLKQAGVSATLFGGLDLAWAVYTTEETAQVPRKRDDTDG